MRIERGDDPSVLTIRGAGRAFVEFRDDSIVVCNRTTPFRLAWDDVAYFGDGWRNGPNTGGVWYLAIGTTASVVSAEKAYLGNRYLFGRPFSRAVQLDGADVVACRATRSPLLGWSYRRHRAEVLESVRPISTAHGIWPPSMGPA